MSEVKLKVAAFVYALSALSVLSNHDLVLTGPSSGWEQDIFYRANFKVELLVSTSLGVLPFRPTSIILVGMKSLSYLALQAVWQALHSLIQQSACEPRTMLMGVLLMKWCCSVIEWAPFDSRVENYISVSTYLKPPRQIGRTWKFVACLPVWQ